MNSAKSAKLFVDQDMAEPELHSIASGVAAVYSSRCPGKETPNEDAAALIPFDSNSGILVVADGAGGFRSGEQAASIAVAALKASIQEAESKGLMLRTAILNGFENANRKVQDLGVGAATTLAVVEIQEDSIRPYHVGDSMILVVGQRRKVKLQTVSHSPVGYAIEAGVLDEDKAMHHEDRHLVSNLLGTPEMRIDLGSTIKLAKRDSLLLASDGLFDNLQTDEIVERLRKGPLIETAQRLATDSAERMREPRDGEPSKPDDLTFVAFRSTAPRRKSSGTPRV